MGNRIRKGANVVGGGYSVSRLDQYIAINATSPVNIALPNGDGVDIENGHEIYLWDQAGTAGVNLVTVATSEKFNNGTNSFFMNKPFQMIKLIYFDSTWFVFEDQTIGAGAAELGNQSITSTHRIELHSQASGPTWTGHSKQFGYNWHQMGEDYGNAAEPSDDWDARGFCLPKGSTVNFLSIKGTGSNNDITDLEVFVRVHDVDASTGLLLNTAADVNQVTLFGPSNIDYLTIAGGAPTTFTGLNSVKIFLGNYVMQNEGNVIVFIRPIGTNTVSRFLEGDITIHYDI